MTREEMAKVMEKVFAECTALRGAGQKEYAHRDDNAFANFERVAERMGISRESALMVYAEKHLDGIHSYIQGHKSQRESVTGRINDVIVYMCLLRGMVEESTEPKSERAANYNKDGYCWNCVEDVHSGCFKDGCQCRPCSRLK